MGTEFQFGKLKFGNGDGCTAIWKYFMPLLKLIFVLGIFAAV